MKIITLIDTIKMINFFVTFNSRTTEVEEEIDKTQSEGMIFIKRGVKKMSRQRPQQVSRIVNIAAPNFTHKCMRSHK